MTAQAVTAPDDRAIRAVAARVFGRPRPYTATSLGGPTLVCAVLDDRGYRGAARRLRDALGPVMAQLEVSDVADLPAALGRFRGRPPDAVTAHLRTDELAGALRGGFDVLGWGELADLLTSWWPDPPVPAVVPELRLRGAWERNEIAQTLAARVDLFREVLAIDPAAWDLPPVDVDRNVRRLAGELLDGVAVAAASRHPNRVGRLLGATLVDRLERAARLRHVTAEAEAAVAEAACLVAAVAEAVTGRLGTGSVGKALAVPSRVEPVAELGWWPSRWWPVLDAWGALSSRSQARMPTMWRLAPAPADVVLAALLWALGSLGSVVAVGGRVRSPVEWRRRWTRELDQTWAPVANQVWGQVQSVRAVCERTPSPFTVGMSRVAWGRSWRYGVLP